MKSFRSLKATSANHGWKKALVISVLLVGCYPFYPYGTCGDQPDCSTFDYKLSISPHHFSNAPPDSATGAILIDTLGFSINIYPGYNTNAIACQNAGRPGFAYALSCEPCSGPNLDVDSLFFTTDLITLDGDTLKSGYNFANLPLPKGFYGYGGSWLMVDSLTAFKDSFFEVRFTGMVDSVPKSGSATIPITNPALLF